MDIRSNIREQQLADKLAVARNITVNGDKGEDINKSVFDDFEPDVIEKAKPPFHRYIERSGFKGHYRYLYPEDMKNARIKTTVEEMVDEDTGDVVKVPRNTPVFSMKTKAKLEAKLKSVNEKYEEKSNEFKKLQDVSDEYDNQIHDLRLQIKDLENDRKQLNVDMEQGVSQAEEQGLHPDIVANEYGDRLNNIDEEKGKCWEEISDLERKRNTLQNDDYWKLAVEVDKLLDEVKYLEEQIASMEFYDITKSEDEDIQKSTGDKRQSKIAKVMREFAGGKLKDSHGNQVTDQKQALAIAYSYFKNDDIEKAIAQVDDIIEKGKWAKPGEIRVWGDGKKYRRTANGWELVKEVGGESKYLNDNQEETISKLKEKYNSEYKVSMLDNGSVKIEFESGEVEVIGKDGKKEGSKEDKVATSIANINRYEKKDIDLLTKVYSNAIKDKEDPKILDAMQKRLQELSKE